MTEPTTAGGAGMAGLAARPVKLGGLVLGLLAALGALFVDGELELTLFMATAVIAALACFDASLDRRIDAFWPWMLVSVAILAKTVPTVVSRLSDHIGPDAERFDHLGAVLFGLCLAVVAFMLARPPAGAEQRTPLAAIVVLAGLLGAVAGASVAFGGASGFGSARAARVFETLGWGSAAAMLAGAVIAAGGIRRPPVPFVALTAGILAAAVVSARTAAGSELDLGWWALVFFVLASGSLGFGLAALGRRTGRRATLAPTVVAVLGAVLGIQATILAAGDGGTWDPGVFVLPVLALGLLGLGLSLYRWGGSNEVDVDRDQAGVFEMIADSTIDQDDGQRTTIEPDPVPVQPSPEASQPASQPVPQPGSMPVGSDGAFSGAVGAPAPAPEPEPAPAPEPQPAGPEPQAAAQPAASEAEPPTEPDPPEEPVVPEPEPVVREPVDTSTAGLEPHLVDPTTGLRSVAGLQAVLVESFGRPRSAAEVSIVMVALRNLGTVEAEHGRVTAARVTSELAQRFSSRLPDAYTARFASDAFAAVIDGPPLDAQTLIPRCADVLSELLEPVVVGDATIEIDVAASMAQCYANEDLAGFIGRANTGLERAVGAAEPSLVAMP